MQVKVHVMYVCVVVSVRLSLVYMYMCSVVHDMYTAAAVIDFNEPQK